MKNLSDIFEEEINKVSEFKSHLPQKATTFEGFTNRKSMIIDKDVSGTGRRHLGYWRTGKLNSTNLPWPKDFIDKTWDKDEQEAVALYLEHAPSVQYWLGSSYCRICNKSPLGSTDKGDDVFAWPEGFSHYIREHNVKPPQEFLDYVLDHMISKP